MEQLNTTSSIGGFASSEWVWLDRRSAIASLDAALIYLRRELGKLLPVYLLAVAPLALVMLFTVDAMATQRRSLAAVIALALTLATFWRWVFLAVIQRRVQAELRGQSPLPVRKRFFTILFGRLIAVTAMSWGSVIVVPGLWGFFASSFISPAALEGEGSIRKRLKQSITLASSSRLINILCVLILAFLLILVSVVALTLLFTSVVISSMLGLNSADLQITFQSLAWIILLLFMILLLFDFYWTVASVFVFYDQQSRPLGTDLRLRLSACMESEA